MIKTNMQVTLPKLIKLERNMENIKKANLLKSKGYEVKWLPMKLYNSK